MKIIAITGGIGSGKSVVARMVQLMGFEVYDCDSRAELLMIHDADVRNQLMAAFGKDVYMPDGSLNRQHLSQVAFSDDQALTRLNAIVHPATARDMIRWADEQAARGSKVAFVETALLRTAGLDRLVDGVWHVTAPDNVRVARVMERNALTAQRIEDTVADGEQVIVNDNDAALLPQVTKLIQWAIN